MSNPYEHKFIVNFFYQNNQYMSIYFICNFIKIAKIIILFRTILRNRNSRKKICEFGTFVFP